MKQLIHSTVVASVLMFAISASAQGEYHPPAGAWDRRTPEQAKLDAVKLKEAVDFALASENKAP